MNRCQASTTAQSAQSAQTGRGGWPFSGTGQRGAAPIDIRAQDAKGRTGGSSGPGGVGESGKSVASALQELGLDHNALDGSGERNDMLTALGALVANTTSLRVSPRFVLTNQN